MKKDPSKPIFNIFSKQPTTFFSRRLGANKSIPLFIALLFCGTRLIAQPVYEHVSHVEIYDFLDELANLGIIELNSAIKPYTLDFIREKLDIAVDKQAELNSRQRETLVFYDKTFQNETYKGRSWIHPQKACFALKDSLFLLHIRPILGVHLAGMPRVDTEPEGARYHRHNGMEFTASLGSHWGGYASLRDNFNSLGITTPEMLTQEPGNVYKDFESGTFEFSELRGGILYSNPWITAGLVKDHIAWGNNYHGANIFSPKAPSFVQLKINIRPAKWLEFNYFHAWLNSEIIDSSKIFNYSGAYGWRKRYVYREKYLAANMFTFKPWKNTFISFGNSIVYADIGLHPAYLIPFAFYKSIDHTLNGVSNAAGQNSQMFMDISTRAIPHTHLYGALFIDEIALGNMFDSEMQSNHLSVKAGFRVSGFPAKNFTLTGEYTRSNPLVYQHFTPTTTFTSNQYNFGHYLRDNAEETFLSLSYTPISALTGFTSFRYARKGPDYNLLGGSRRGLPFIESEKWRQSIFSIGARYRLAWNAAIGLTWQWVHSTGSAVYQYTPDWMKGRTNYLDFVIYLGL